MGVTTPYRHQVTKAADGLDQTEADTVHKFQGRQKQVVILTMVLDETWRGRTGPAFVDDPQLINVVSVFDLLYRAYSRRLRSLATRLRRELKYPSEDTSVTVSPPIPLGARKLEVRRFGWNG